MWVALSVGGLLGSDFDCGPHRELLGATAGGLPGAVEIVYRHGIEVTDCFEMKPGYHNFQPIDHGDEVAYDRNGPVLAPMSGLMMLPRYQGEGEDGYFIAQHASL